MMIPPQESDFDSSHHYDTGGTAKTDNSVSTLLLSLAFPLHYLVIHMWVWGYQCIVHALTISVKYVMFLCSPSLDMQL